MSWLRAWFGSKTGARLAKKTQNRKPAPDHQFSVVWNQERRRFDIFRDAMRTASFARDRSTAVGIAIREAQQEARLTGKTLAVSSVRDGKRIVEWEGGT